MTTPLTEEPRLPAEAPREPRPTAPTAVRALLVLAVGYTLYVAKPVLLPVAIAVMLALVLRPLVSWLRRVWVPKPLGAAILLLALVAAVGYAAWVLREPAARWIEEAPRSLTRMERKLGELRQPMEKVTRAAEKVEEIAGGGAPEAGQVEIQQPGVVETALSGLWHLGAAVLVTLVLVYLLLVYDDVLLGRVVAVLPRLRDKRRAVLIARELEQQMSRYLLTVTVINLAEGAAVGTAMQLLGMPNPWLWGAMAAVVNFVPYLGALVGIAVVGVVALLSLEPIGYALLAPVSYAAINFVEGMVISPIVLGKRFELNPVVVFVWLFGWGWIWGIGGALLAVPLLAMVKIVADRVPSLAAVGELLGGEPKLV
jgi:predicted PurR-regulated permease PerM